MYCMAPLFGVLWLGIFIWPGIHADPYWYWVFGALLAAAIVMMAWLHHRFVPLIAK
jgi:hypothetical protein